MPRGDEPLNRTTLLILIVVIAVAFVSGVVGSTLSSGSSATHSMPDGSTMDGGRMP